MAGLWCTKLGYGNQELITACGLLAHLFGAKSHDQAVLLAEKLKKILPAPTSRVVHFFRIRGQRYAREVRLVLQECARVAGENRRAGHGSEKRRHDGVCSSAYGKLGLCG